MKVWYLVALAFFSAARKAAKKNRQVENLPLADFGRVTSKLKVMAIVCFCTDSKRFFILSLVAENCRRALRLFFFVDCGSYVFNLLIKSTFLASKGLLCLYKRQSNTWFLADM